MRDLTVYIPTRGRPSNMLRLSKALHETTTEDTNWLFIIDRDDYSSQQAADDNHLSWANPAQDVPSGGMVAPLNSVVMEDLTPCGSTFELEGVGVLCDCNKFSDSYAVAFIGDDMLPRTHGWDARYLDELRAGNLLTFGNDLLQSEKMPTAVAMNADIPRTLGYMAPPGLTHLYADNVWKLWGEALQSISYLPDVIIEHLHYTNGKTTVDDTYERVNNDQARHAAVTAFY